MTALDTNVLIYACDRSDRRKQQIALDLIGATTDGVLLLGADPSGRDFHNGRRILGRLRVLSSLGGSSEDDEEQRDDYIHHSNLRTHSDGAGERSPEKRLRTS